MTTAIDTTKQQMLDEAVQEGKITQEQADRIAARKGGGFCGFGFNDGRMGTRPKLNVLKAAGGRNLDGMAVFWASPARNLRLNWSLVKYAGYPAEHGLTVEEFRQKMQEQREAQIARDVADGKITQEQADKIPQNRGLA